MQSKFEYIIPSQLLILNQDTIIPAYAFYIV